MKKTEIDYIQDVEIVIYQCLSGDITEEEGMKEIVAIANEYETEKLGDL